MRRREGDEGRREEGEGEERAVEVRESLPYTWLWLVCKSAPYGRPAL